MDKLNKGRERLYDAVEQGTVPRDETLHARFRKLQARQSELLLEMETLKDRRQLGIKKVSDAQIDAFCAAVKARFEDPFRNWGSLPASATWHLRKRIDCTPVGYETSD